MINIKKEMQSLEYITQLGYGRDDDLCLDDSVYDTNKNISPILLDLVTHVVYGYLATYIDKAVRLSCPISNRDDDLNYTEELRLVELIENFTALNIGDVERIDTIQTIIENKIYKKGIKKNHIYEVAIISGYLAVTVGENIYEYRYKKLLEDYDTVVEQKQEEEGDIYGVFDG